MSDLSIISLVVIIASVMTEYMLGKLKIWFYKIRYKKREKLVIQSSDEMKTKSKKRIKRNYIVNGLFFSAIFVYISSSGIEFVFSTLIMICTYVIAYLKYEKQKVTYYLMNEGVVCLKNTPLIDKEVGFRAWKNVEGVDNFEEACYIWFGGIEYKIKMSEKEKEESRKYLSNWS